jgi:hypothetical protein
MDVKTTIEEKGDYLHITAVGRREGYDDFVTGAKNIYGAAISHKVKYVLMDCSELLYVNVSYSDAFNLVRFYEQELSEFKNILISTIGNPENLEVMKFWESICLKRGYKCRVFPDEIEAKQWLDSELNA